MKKFLIKSGCRSSKLSLIQTQNSLNAIQSDLPDVQFEIVGMLAFGDKHKNMALDDAATPEDIWTRELDEKLLQNEIDIAVHSAKDLPPKLKEGLDYFWLPWAEEAGDVLILRPGETLQNLPANPVVAISSERRSAYVQKYFPSAIMKPIRGTIEERITQLDRNDFDILIMAEAALNRLELQSRISYQIPLHELPPPEGQGKIAITFKHNNPIALLIRDLYIHPVTFVGAGTGDPDLLTLKGQKAIKNADCVLYDALVNPLLLEHAAPDAEMVFVGKRSGKHSMSQEEITQLILTKVKQGKKVVRLKGGDPSIFGRLAEELSELQKFQIPYRVIPGISALNGVTSAAGILLTARGVNQSFLTATATTETLEKNYLQQYAEQKQPVVFFMGLQQLDKIVATYLQAGHPAHTPIAIISETYGATCIRGTLETIETEVKKSNLTAPALIAIGDFALPENDRRSPLPILNGYRVLLPGVKESIVQLAEAIESQGGVAIQWPLVQLTRSDSFLSQIQTLSTYDLIVLPSPAAVRFLFEQVVESQAVFSKNVEFAVTGPGTAHELKKFGRFPQYMPDTNFSSEGLIQKLKQFDLSQKNILIGHSDIGGSSIKNYLATIAKVTTAILYQNSLRTPQKDLPHFDAVLFTSPSSVQNYIQLYPRETLQHKVVGVIGKVTHKAAINLGLQTSFVASASHMQGLVDALSAYLQNEKFKKISQSY